MLEAALFPRKLAFNFLLFCMTLLLEPEPELVPEPYCITVPVLVTPRQKVVVAAVQVPVLAPVSQHCCTGLSDYSFDNLCLISKKN